jgi:flavorubredoxin
MPSNEILKAVLTRLERYDMEMIAPQHGSIIKKERVRGCIDFLKGLECGDYLKTL